MYDMVLYVISEVRIGEDEISEDKKESGEDDGRHKGDSMYDEDVCESKYIERKEMLKNNRSIRRKISLLDRSIYFYEHFVGKREE